MTAKTGALVLGGVFVLAGLAAFVPNPLIGSSGIFVTNPMHDHVFHVNDVDRNLHVGLSLILLAAGVLIPGGNQTPQPAQ